MFQGIIPVRVFPFIALCLCLSACASTIPKMTDESAMRLCSTQAILISHARENVSGTFVIGTSPEDGGVEFVRNLKACICASIAATAVEELQPNHDLDQHTIVSRTALHLNGEPLHVEAVSKYPIISEVSYSEWPSGEQIEVATRFGICWHSNELSSGNHQAELSYTDSSGEVTRYTWDFEVQ